ncbi:hypothetical protein H2203_003184 [Taxawa tesnikishii (nom. ined.)]|nr:hypothetical protein H2203_003184 [Dothideales sp. JES 119]
MTILYGSNSGTCSAFAQRLAADAPAHGFNAVKVDSLDSANQSLPKDHPVEDDKTDVSYAVFGAGHSDWKQTFHRIPTAIDNILAAHGGKRLCERGGADAAHGDMFSDFETWEDSTLWPALARQYGTVDGEKGEKLEATASQGLSVEVTNVRSSTLRADVTEAKVVSTKLLTAPDVPPKQHIEIALPTDMAYSSGDYLAVLPINPRENVQRVMRHFGLAWDSVLTIKAQAGTILPTNTPITALDLFGAYVELSQPATRRNVSTLSEACADEQIKAELLKLAGDDYSEDISGKRVSVMDLLERFPSVKLPLGSFIATLPPMRTRSYSISSSALWNPHHVTLTYSVLNQPSISGHGRYVGVASNYLSKLEPGDTLHVSVRPSNQAFHLPADSENTPVIMIGAGTGLAPFRGFVQERAAQVGAGRSLAPALLFIGCRDPDKDELYRDEFDRWERMGAVQIFRAYSRKPEASNGHRYVQDAVWDNKDKVRELWLNGAKALVCGSRELEQSVRKVSCRIYKEKHEEASDEDVEKWFEGHRNARFATDVFS